MLKKGVLPIKINTRIQLQWINCSGDSNEGWVAHGSRIFAWPHVWPPSCFLNFKIVWLTYARLPNAFWKILAILSTAPDVSCVVICKRHRENRDTISIAKPQLIICPYFGWFVTFRCVCDVSIASNIASTAANKLRWRIWPNKIQYQSH